MLHICSGNWDKKMKRDVASSGSEMNHRSRKPFIHILIHLQLNLVQLFIYFPGVIHIYWKSPFDLLWTRNKDLKSGKWYNVVKSVQNSTPTWIQSGKKEQCSDQWLPASDSSSAPLAVVCICFSVFLCHIISYHILHGISFLCHITSLCFRSVHSFEKIKIISPKWKRLQAYESFFSKHALFGCLLGVFMYCSNHCQILCCHEGPRNRKEKKYGWMTMNDCRMFLDLDPSYDTSPPWPCKSWTEFWDTAAVTPSSLLCRGKSLTHTHICLTVLVRPFHWHNY